MNQTATRTKLASFTLVLMAVTPWLLAADAPTSGQRDFPCHRGYNGDGSSISDKPLVTTLEQAKPLWTSEAEVPVVAAGYPGTILATDFSFPVIANGLVFFHYENPNPSELFTRTMIQHSRAGGMRQVVDIGAKLSEEDKRLFASINTDDTVLGIDAETGRTRWKTVFPKFGVKGLRYGPMLTPCAAYGRVYVMGSGGHVFGLDAATGEPLWISDLGAFHRHIEQMRILTQKTGVRAYGKTAEVLNTSPTFADGVIVCCAHDQNPMNSDPQKPTDSVIGFAADTGRRLWEKPEMLHHWVSPVRWAHKGKEYVILGSQRGAAAVEPSTGRTLWAIPPGGGDSQPDLVTTIPSYGFFTTTPTISEHYLVATKNFGKGGGKNPNDKGPTCWRITPEGAKQIWSLDASLCHNPMSFVAAVISGANAYFHAGGGVLCVELATGKVVGSCKIEIERLNAMTAIGDRIFVKPGSVRMVVWTGSNLEVAPGELGPIDGYTLPTPANGRLFFRGNHHITCYDLRSEPPVSSAIVPTGTGLASPYFQERITAAAMLADSPTPSNLNALATAATSGHWPSVDAACTALEQLSPKASTVAQRLTAALPSAVDGKHLGTAQCLIRSLQAISPDALAASIPTIAERLASADPGIVRVACQALEAAGPHAGSATESLARVMRGTDTHAAELAAAACAAIGPPSRGAAPAVQALLRHEDRAVRAQALQTLLAMGPDVLAGALPDALPVLADRRSCVILCNDWQEQQPHFTEDRQSTIESASFVDHVLEKLGPSALDPVAAFLTREWAEIKDDQKDVAAPLWLVQFTAVSARRLSTAGPKSAVLAPIIKRVIQRKEDGSWAATRNYYWTIKGNRTGPALARCLAEAMENIEAGGKKAVVSSNGTPPQGK